MVRTVVYISVNAQYWESAKDTGLACLFNTLAYSRDVFLRNSTAHNGRSELEGLFCVCFHWCKVNLTVTVLSTSTGLLRILAVNINSLGKCLLVSNLRRAYVCLNVELTEQTVNNDVQMELAHTGDNGLASLFIGTHTEGRILLSQLNQRIAHLILACFGLWLDSDINNRLWEFHGLQDNRILLVTDGIAGGSHLKSNCSCDIAGVNPIQLVSLVGMHLKNTSNTLLLALGCVQYVRTGVQAS